MSFALLDETVIRDNHTLAVEAKGLSMFLFQQAFECEDPVLEGVMASGATVQLTFTKENLIQIGTLLYQLGAQVAKDLPV